MWIQIRSLIWVYTVCQRGFLNISVDDKKNEFCIDCRYKGKIFSFFHRREPVQQDSAQQITMVLIGMM